MRIRGALMQDDSHDLNLLAGFAEGRLDEQERARALAHLAQCRVCRAPLAEHGRVAATPPAPAAAVPPERNRSRWPGARTWLRVAASVVLCTFAGLAFVRGPAVGPVEPAAGGAFDEQLLVRRGAVRVVAGKTFRVRAGEWTDTSFNADAQLPAVSIRGPRERAEWLMRIPELEPYARLGNRVTVVWNGTAYRFSP
jgi:hypothetical protein